MPVHETTRVMSCSVRADPQRSRCACRKTTVPRMHAGSGGATKLPGEISLLDMDHPKNTTNPTGTGVREDSL